MTKAEQKKKNRNKMAKNTRSQNQKKGIHQKTT